MNKLTHFFSDECLAWHVLPVNTIKNETGKLTVLEGKQHIIFETRRIFFIHEMQRDAVRGKHSHIELKQILICVNGQFDLHINDGREKQKFTMKAGSHAIYLHGRIWREMRNFSENCVLAVLCDKEYEDDTVIYDIDHALRLLDECYEK